MEFTQYKKLQKYYLGSPVIPAEYKKGDLIITDDFDSLESCQNDSAPIDTEYWVYPRGEAVIYGSKDGFTFTLDHTDANYYYYVISGSGTNVVFTAVKVISGGLLNTSNVTYFMRMFKNCTRLTSLDVSSWDTSKVTVLEDMFYNCTSLTSLDLSSFNTYKVTNMFRVFYGCTALETLDISGWDTSKVYDMDNMFYGCSSLRTIYMRGCSSDTIADIESALTDAGIRDNVTIVTA